jgi:hypothetical protein
MTASCYSIHHDGISESRKTLSPFRYTPSWNGWIVRSERFNSFAARRIERRQSSARSKGAPLLSESPKTIDVDDAIDPKWLHDGTLDENYDNGFDVNVFSTEAYSCFVNYNDFSSLASQNWWISLQKWWRWYNLFDGHCKRDCCFGRTSSRHEWWFRCHLSVANDACIEFESISMHSLLVIAR